jgi:hypothetical protein
MRLLKKTWTNYTRDDIKKYEVTITEIETSNIKNERKEEKKLEKGKRERERERDK